MKVAVKTEWLKSFIEETLKGWRAVDDFRRDPKSEKKQWELMRFVHTLKGNASILGVETLSDQAHAIESDVLSLMKATELNAGPLLRSVEKGLLFLEKVLVKITGRTAISAPVESLPAVMLRCEIAPNEFRDLECKSVVEILRRPGFFEIPGTVASPRYAILRRNQVVPLIQSAPIAFEWQHRQNWEWAVVVEGQGALPALRIVGFVEASQ